MFKDSQEIIDKYINSPYQSLLLELTSDCNKNCSFCYQKKRVVDRKYINDTFFNQCIELISTNHINQVIFSGGEPLMHKDILKYIDILNNIKVKVLIITNGLLLNDLLLAELEKRKNVTVKVSVEINDSEHVFKLIKRINNYDIRTRAAITLYSDESKEVKKIIEQFSEFKIPVEVAFPMFKGNAKYSKNEIYRLKEILKELISLSLDKKIQVESQYISAAIDNYFIPQLSRFNNCSVCKAIKIDIEGQIFACPYFLSSKYVIGNINNEVFVNKGTSEQIQKEMFINKKNDKCFECKWNNICGAGCLAMSEEGNEKDYSCEITKYAYETINEYFNKY